jgi:SAM-dependent methyltransferase
LDVAESVWNKEKLPGPGLGRLKQVAAAEIITIQRVQGFLQPARLALEQMGNANIIEESLTVKVGWNLEALIPFLLRDWQPRAEKSTAMQVISSALEIAFPQGGAAIAFAGCGGGGLLESASRRFNHVIGFDLSIPILAAASELLAGQRLLLATTTSCIEGVRACEIELGPFPPASPGVSLMVTDGAATGFRTSALDGVVTQFLLDIVPDPRSVATEVYRILADGGVWLNYGPSGPRGGIWHFDARETSAFLDAAGFDVIEATTHRTTHLDNSSVDPFLSFQSHVCHLVVGRKRPERQVFDLIPSLVPADVLASTPTYTSDAQLVQRQDLPHGPTVLVLALERIRGRPEYFEIGKLAARILRQVDGIQTVRSIVDRLNADGAGTGEEVAALFREFYSLGIFCCQEKASSVSDHD